MVVVSDSAKRYDLWKYPRYIVMMKHEEDDSLVPFGGVFSAPDLPTAIHAGGTECLRHEARPEGGRFYFQVFGLPESDGVLGNMVYRGCAADAKYYTETEG